MKKSVKQYVINNTSVMVDDEKPLVGKVLCAARVQFLRGLVHISPRREGVRVRHSCVYKADEVLVMTRNSQDREYMLRVYLTRADVATNEAVEDKLYEVRKAMYAARKHFWQSHSDPGDNTKGGEQ